MHNVTMKTSVGAEAGTILETLAVFLNDLGIGLAATPAR
jgi:hypothetical protein